MKSKDKIIDLFTNSLPKDTFEYLSGKLGSFSYPKFTKWRCMLRQFMDEQKYLCGADARVYTLGVIMKLRK